MYQYACGGDFCSKRPPRSQTSQGSPSRTGARDPVEGGAVSWTCSVALLVTPTVKTPFSNSAYDGGDSMPQPGEKEGSHYFFKKVSCIHL